MIPASQSRQKQPAPMLAITLRVCLLWACLIHCCSAQSPTPPANPTSVSQPIPVPPDPQKIASAILQRTLIDSVWGKPMICDMRQTIDFGPRRMSGSGQYVRGGLGSGRLWMSLRFPAGKRINGLQQISNGELLYTMRKEGDTVERWRVDLGKVRERITLTTESLQDPVIAMYLAIGGQSEVLRKLTQQYEWQKVTKGKLGDTPVWWLTGSLSSTPPPVRALAPVDTRLFQPKHSGLTPTQVVVAISHKDAKYPFWLLQVEQSRPADSLTPIGNGAGIKITTEWSDATESTTPINKFEPKASSDPFTEETPLYMPPGPIGGPTSTAATNSALQR